jgi:hypothetical protein
MNEKLTEEELAQLVDARESLYVSQMKLGDAQYKVHLATMEFQKYATDIEFIQKELYDKYGDFELNLNTGDIIRDGN